MDILSDVLEALRVSGAVVLHHRYARPWAIRIPGSGELASVLGVPASARVVAFHIAERGEFALEMGEHRRSVGPGELVVCFGGQPHLISCGGKSQQISLADVLAGSGRLPQRGDGPGSTQLLCGVFILDEHRLNPLLNSLPKVLWAPVFDGPLSLIARLLQRELESPKSGSGFIQFRALEVLCAELLRVHLTSGPPDDVGFFQMLRDHRLVRSLEQFHRAPGAAWSSQRLADVAGLSRSRFTALFAAKAGEGPMRYVTRWRMNIASRLLRNDESSVEAIADAVGYSNVPAFSRAFKRAVGVSPSTFRARTRSAQPTHGERVGAKTKRPEGR